jgi:hypothetical protein
MATMAKTYQCAGCNMCGQGDCGEHVQNAASGVRFVGTLSLDPGGSLVTNTNERPCTFCGHRLAFHPRLGVGP